MCCNSGQVQAFTLLLITPVKAVPHAAITMELALVLWSLAALRRRVTQQVIPVLLSSLKAPPLQQSLVLNSVRAMHVSSAEHLQHIRRCARRPLVLLVQARLLRRRAFRLLQPVVLARTPHLRQLLYPLHLQRYRPLHLQRCHLHRRQPNIRLSLPPKNRRLDLLRGPKRVPRPFPW